MLTFKKILPLLVFFFSSSFLMAQTYVSTYAGNGTMSYKNGAKLKSEFNSPYCICFDASGNMFITDTHNERVRKITLSGTVSSLAGNGTSGSSNGTGSAAEFYNPKGICMDSKGNFYVVDAINFTIRKITAAGKVTTLTSFPNTTYSGVDMCIDSSDNLYLADNGSNKVEKINTSTGKLTTFAGNGTAGERDGSASYAELNGPNGICIDKAQNIYTTDLWANTIRKITPSGHVTTITGTGSAGHANGSLSTATFNNPHSVVIDDQTGLLYVSDAGNNIIRKIDTVNGTVTTLAGMYSTSGGYRDGRADSALLNAPRGMYIHHGGGSCTDTTYLYFADIDNNVIRRINIGNTTAAGSSTRINLCSGASDTIGSTSISGCTYSWSSGANLNDSSVSNPSFLYVNNTSSNANFTYILTTTTSGTSCSRKDTINITVYPAMTKPSISINVDTLTTVSGYSYDWSFNGVPVTDSANRLLGTGTGNYSVTITNANGCSSTSNITYHRGLNTVYGYVSQSNSNPLANSKIYLLHYNANDTTVTALDSTTTDSSGYYSFSTRDSLVFLYAFVDSSSYPNELPTYYDSAVAFPDAHGVIVTNGGNRVDFATIHGSNPGGTGFIGGKVTICTICKKAGSGAPAANITVILKDDNGKPLMETKTDGKGNFLFKNLPVGKYSIWVDKPLMDNSVAPTVELTTKVVKQQNLEFTLYPKYLELDQSTVTAINENQSDQQNFNIYPNPFSTNANIEYFLQAPENVLIEAYDVTGRKMTLFTGMSQAGTHQFNINAKELKLSPGVYMIRFTSGSTTYTQKVVCN